MIYNNIKIKYSGIALGNMDSRFSKDYFKNQLNLFKKIKSKSENVAIIEPRNLNKFIDLNFSSKKIKKGSFVCDALISNTYGQAMALFPADCVPLVIGSFSNPIVVLIHIGRNNIQMNFIEEIISYIMHKYKISPNFLFAYIGPSIKNKSYIFTSVNKKQFKDKGWNDFITKKKGKFYVDLVGLTIKKLVECGFNKKNIKLSSIDIGSNLKFYSHRRSILNKEIEGRNGFIAQLSK